MHVTQRTVVKFKIMKRTRPQSKSAVFLSSKNRSFSENKTVTISRTLRRLALSRRRLYAAWVDRRYAAPARRRLRRSRILGVFIVRFF